jgi:hypothetical protein
MDEIGYLMHLFKFCCFQEYMHETIYVRNGVSTVSSTLN